MVITYTLTIFLSASLLFAVQPMMAKLLLPLMGGSTSVWTTSMLFFQATLLLGYLYAHLGQRVLGVRNQVKIHIPLMLIACVVLPLGISRIPENPQWPAFWVLATLALSVGLPFFVLSASSPMLQSWFAHTGHKDAADPYWLYGASNLGSMLALLSYPLLIEPSIGVQTQTLIWSASFVALIFWTAACGFLLLTRGGQHPTPASASVSDTVAVRTIADEPVTWARRGRWVLWAFLPSSLMLGVTAFITVDISSVPLFWVVPLALYLLTFILVFSRRIPHLGKFAGGLLLVVALAVIGLTHTTWLAELGPSRHEGLLILLHLLLFFCVAFFFHDQFARDRPHPRHLTEYFLLLSVGGALGGLFNALLAPVVFVRVVEYLVVLVVALMVIPVRLIPASPAGRAAVSFVGAAIVFGFFVMLRFFDVEYFEWSYFGAAVGMTVAVFVISYFFQPFRNVAVIVAASVALYVANKEPWVIHYERSFYAAYSVYDQRMNSAGDVRFLAHGTTIHGAQQLDPKLRRVPIGYHHFTSGVGQLMDRLNPQRVAVVGLGAGVIATYGGPQREIVFFEIDPEIETVAREYFSFLDDCAASCTVEIGDGRLLLEHWDGEPFDLIFLDAYSSGSVPTHLLTREALQIYLSRLTETGILVFQVSNRYLDVEGVVGALAEDAGLIARTFMHSIALEEGLDHLWLNDSNYTVVVRDESHLGPFALDEEWWAAYVSGTLWTDDFTDIWSIVQW